MKLLCITTVLAAFIVACSHGAGAQTYLGAGGINCRKFAAMAASNDPIATSVDHWLLGYVSGLNMVWKGVKGNDRLIHSEGPEVAMYALHYCEANPGKSLLNAANDYFFSLPQ